MQLLSGVDQTAHRTDTPADLRDARIDVRALGDIGPDRHRISAARDDLGGNGLAFGSGPADDGDARAFLSKRQRDAATDALAGAGDQCDRALKDHVGRLASQKCSSGRSTNSNTTPSGERRNAM